MAHDHLTIQVKAAQERALRIACDPRRYGLTLAHIGDLSGVSYGAVRNWAGHSGEPSVMSLASFWHLAEVLPVELLSSLCPPGFHLRRDEELDHDDLAAGCAEYSTEYARARHPDSPEGVAIAPCEAETLSARAGKLRAA